MVNGSNYKQDIWTWIIQYGGACAVKNGKSLDGKFFWQGDIERYYSASLDIDYELTRKAIETIKTIGIDWYASDDPADHIGDGFAGTFTSHQLKFYYLGGRLVMKDGQKFYWGVHVDEDACGFAGVISLITQTPDLETAIDKVEERLAKYKTDTWGFRYNCNLPIRKVQQWEITE